MNDSDLLRLADLNRTEYWCESLNWMPGSEVFKHQDAVFINSAINFLACNVAFNLSAGPDDDIEGFLSRAKDFFEKRKPAFSLLLRGHDDRAIVSCCQELKMPMISNNAGMVLDEPVKGEGLPDGAELRWVEDARELESFKQVAAEAFHDLGLPTAITEKYFAQAGRVLSPYALLSVVYYQGEPASAAMALLSHGIAGIYWVGTIKKARGLGLAEYCTREVGNAAFSVGARKVVLQASKFGEPVYRKIGYREITCYPWFICSGKLALK
jgi:ribosomal protein S18 acetylase RimI-like enzyme